MKSFFFLPLCGACRSLSQGKGSGSKNILGNLGENASSYDIERISSRVIFSSMTELKMGPPTLKGSTFTLAPKDFQIGSQFTITWRLNLNHISLGEIQPFSVGIYRHKKEKPWKSYDLQGFLYSERDLNPHEHCCSLDFKSNVSTDSTIRAWKVFPIPWSGNKCPMKKKPWQPSVTSETSGDYSSRQLSEKRDSHPRPPPWQGGALPTELFSRFCKNSAPCPASLPGPVALANLKQFL